MAEVLSDEEVRELALISLEFAGEFSGRACIIVTLVLNIFVSLPKIISSGRCRHSVQSGVNRQFYQERESFSDNDGTANTCESGGIGRRAGFRYQWGNPWEFKSPLSHHYQEVLVEEIRNFEEDFSLVCKLMVVPLPKGEVVQRPKYLLTTAGVSLASRKSARASVRTKFPRIAMRALSDLVLSTARVFARSRCYKVICCQRSLA